MKSRIYNFLQIDEGLSTSGQPTENQLRALAADGYDVIINLALHDDPRYSLPDEKGLVEDLGMVYVHIPVQFDAPTEENLLDFFRAVDTHRHRKLHIHCAANMRVTAFLGLYRMLKDGMPKHEAFEPMASIWEPDEIWGLFISGRS
jgi:protein tyrosine phosphatase (PTP) superfamily phosphohydrolase (DUF442 family)